MWDLLEIVFGVAEIVSDSKRAMQRNDGRPSDSRPAWMTFLVVSGMFWLALAVDFFIVAPRGNNGKLGSFSFFFVLVTVVFAIAVLGTVISHLRKRAGRSGGNSSGGQPGSGEKYI